MVKNMRNPNIKFGTISRKITLWEKNIQLAGQNGFDHVELRIDDVEEDSLVFNPVFQQKIRDLLQQYQLTVSVHGIEAVDFGEEVKRIRSTLLDILEAEVKAADSLGAQWITFHIGRCHFRNRIIRKEPFLNRAAETLEELLSRTKGCDVKVGLENMPRKSEAYGRCYLGDCTEELSYILRSMSQKRAGAVLDVGHALLNPETRKHILQGYIELKPFLSCVHFHWNDFNDDLHSALYHIDAQKNSAFLTKFFNGLRNGETLVLEMDLLEGISTRDLVRTVYQI